MELSEYILQNMTDRLLIRLILNRSSRYGAGTESVRANLVSCDRQRGVMLRVDFECQAGSGMGNISIFPWLDSSDFGRVAGRIAIDWEREYLHGWGEQREAVCVFVPPRPRSRTRQPVQRVRLDVSHVLVLQHLARIMGALGSATLTMSSVDKLNRADHAIATMTGRLQALIAEGNRKFDELSRLVSLG